MDNIIVIDDEFLDDDTIVAQECKLEHDNMTDVDAEDTAQANDTPSSDVTDTHKEVNPMQMEDTLGSAANPDDQSVGI